MSKNKKKRKQKSEKQRFEQPVVFEQPHQDLDLYNEEIADEFRPHALDNVEPPLNNQEEPVELGSPTNYYGADFGGDDVEFSQELREYREEERQGSQQDFDVETAAEIGATPGLRMDDTRGDATEEIDESEAGKTEGNGIGTIGIILSVLAFFIVPFLLGPAGIVLGIISARRGSKLGWWAVGVGSAAILLTAFITPITGF